MDPRRFARIKELVLRARSLPTGERIAFVRAEAAADPALAEEVLALLEQDVRPARIVEEGAVPVAAEAPHHPESVGPYRIVDVLGEGGMGVVYRAVQEEPIRREVALKLVRRGMDSERVLRRFHWERQSLARMHHPHIATVLDAGTDEAGHPWFVMPLVEGLPITTFCDRERLGIPERLDLFAEVCRAVQHAHQRGVLHRDLKPSNVMVRRVGGRPVPTVIDFGIAKALLPGDEERGGGLTLDGQRIGTPSYMSPEQLHGEESSVDTRSDVYALGVMLYELLVGCHPWSQTGETAPTGEQGRRAPSPSEAVTREKSEERARERNTSPRALRRRLRGDLDTICLMAVRPEPERRYASAAHLADDLQRYRRGEPVSARPDSWRYRAGKFMRRHPAGVTVAALVVVLIGVSAGFLVWHAGRMQQQRDRAVVAEERARREAAAATSISDFLEDIFVLAQPGQGGPAELSATELLRQGVERVPTELEGQPYLQARMLNALGRVHHSLSMLDEAESLLVAGLEVIEDDDARSTEERHRVRGRLRQLLATVLHDQGHPLEAAHYDSLAIEDFHRVEGEEGLELATSLNSLGINLQAAGRLDEAVGPIRRSLEMQERLGGEVSDADIAWGWGTLGYLDFRRGDVAAAADRFVHALEMARRLFDGQDHYDLAHALNNRGGVLLHLDRLDEAEAILEEALQMCERMYASQEHAALGRAVANRAWVARLQGDLDDALAGYRRSLGILRRTLGESHPRVAVALQGIGETLMDRGELEAAERVLVRADSLRQAVLPLDHADVARTRLALGRLLIRRGQTERGLVTLREHRKWCYTERPPGHFLRGKADAALGAALLEAGRREEAREHLRMAETTLLPVFGPDHRTLREIRSELARLADASDPVDVLR